ncbi:ribose 5-phosphate isomerase B [Microtetraspora sp. NBRC 13810]|uniref:RpiB/LacA/LacB family sugar-phosphate isomerase n=1 Tax=Microtetraspora sp. NBRC 13810 TaxID=3030990 RepID=UPI0024A2B47D|nr:RpiB/LacA/LacB family sugar-phosphate isomerase [Microtetraspora sp. NBRC 13810]GLW12622.1 ribose 5-phosphate isomerase B [Microtetraspora sp. NBRC 13810]
MRISLASDSLDGVASLVAPELERRGHTVILHGALADGRADWAWSCSEAAADVAAGRADQAIVCCWTGTGASIAANKVPGVRAALCVDAVTADGARTWNDANALALSLRLTSPQVLVEILDAWFAGTVSPEDEDRANIARITEVDRGFSG